MAGYEGESERMWDEYDWERFLQQQDHKTEQYMQLLEKYLDDYCVFEARLEGDHDFDGRGDATFVREVDYPSAAFGAATAALPSTRRNHHPNGGIPWRVATPIRQPLKLLNERRLVPSNYANGRDSGSGRCVGNGLG